MIKIPLENGVNLVAVQSTDPNFAREIYVGVEDNNGVWLQDLVIVQQAYDINPIRDGAEYIDGKYRVLVYGDKNNEDFTNEFKIDEIDNLCFE